MELNTKYHDQIREAFERQCPFWTKDVKECKPRGPHSIRVFLNSGDVVDYNGVTNTFRHLRPDQIRGEDASDITDEDCRAVFSANLVERMRTVGVGQAELSRRTGISVASISKYLNRQATPSLTNIQRIAKALGCYHDDLMV